ncbi:hypothetical protein CC85DRAFT_287891 [Cutaneotrichosporon oleaginosum]|uniref:Uncharacterized protein n=1 Tax=Cutaneotrichosporon oleaginosum TaxID=879819 RepID=A0A0J0XG23_9TREE|nr:uncharacterized protein CC85DRAFT_287891 [Cutaneotrichosporon oleaginosum]KLT40007.1 hypothetical protein CC85DRAFT_287891 [Cutaneotrichosporon oleaginosum]TXT13850.1 hypothetical protein COLE_00043 [Cutaneotrichosporon oleaginosum]
MCHALPSFSSRSMTVFCSLTASLHRTRSYHPPTRLTHPTTTAPDSPHTNNPHPSIHPSLFPHSNPGPFVPLYTRHIHPPTPPADSFPPPCSFSLSLSLQTL